MAEQKERRRWLLMLPVILAVVALIGVLVFQFRSGIQVTVENTGNTPFKSVVLHVTGESYNLGAIALGESATVRVNPTGESHLEVDFVDPDGQAQRLNVDCYFESSYRGTIKVEIKDGVIDKFEDKTKIW